MSKQALDNLAKE